MILRKIRESEFRRAEEVFHLSFEFPLTEEKTSEEMRRERAEAPCGRFDRQYGERWAALEDDDETMMSVLTATAYPMRFDGQAVPMRGIGGVSTLPAYRRRGAVRACLAAALRETAAQGAVFSYLYPFSTAFYSRFGYGLGCERTEFRLPVADRLPYPDTGGTASLVEKGRYVEDYRTVYEAFSARYNLMIAREDMDYEPLRRARPERDCEYTYVWKDADGVPKGSMTFRIENREIGCREFFFTDAEGLRGLLNHAHAFRSHADRIRFLLPVDRDIAPLIPEWEGARRERQYAGMVRVLNVQRVLELARYRGSGRAAVAVDDPLLTENSGLFIVEYREGRALSVAKAAEENGADIVLSIGDFSRLIVGAASLESLCFAGRIAEETAASPALNGVFYEKPCLIADFF